LLAGIVTDKHSNMDDDAVFPLWQDRNIKFDSPDKWLQSRPGEFIIEKFDHIEDTKGNNGKQGQLIVTNLRMVWINTQKPSINLSIGLNCIMQIKCRIATSKLKGRTESVYILTKCNKIQFEFIFTNLVSKLKETKPFTFATMKVADSPKLFSILIAIHRSYETSKLYREIKLRGAIVESKSLKLLPLEQLYEKINGTMNLCSNQATLGTMYITNVRVAWHANTLEAFNISLPYIHIMSIKIRDSKFGMALVLETYKSTGSYVLGFRIDPPERLKAIVKEINNLNRVFTSNPIFGVEYEVETQVSLYCINLYIMLYWMIFCSLGCWGKYQ
jgi:Bardet-Biedl syndrome 5 protein